MNHRSEARLLLEQTSRVSAAWYNLSSVWRDEVAARFESEFWHPIIDGATRYQAAVENLEDVLEEIERGRD